eukprot:1160827-Pelagomonas_calceolata.AAC.10
MRGRAITSRLISLVRPCCCPAPRSAPCLLPLAALHPLDKPGLGALGARPGTALARQSSFWDPAAFLLSSGVHKLSSMSAPETYPDLPAQWSEDLKDEKGEPMSKRCADPPQYECACNLFPRMLVCSEFKKRQKQNRVAAERAEKAVRCASLAILDITLPPTHASRCSHLLLSLWGRLSRVAQISALGALQPCLATQAAKVQQMSLKPKAPEGEGKLEEDDEERPANSQCFGHSEGWEDSGKIVGAQHFRPRRPSILACVDLGSQPQNCVPSLLGHCFLIVPPKPEWHHIVMSEHSRWVAQVRASLSLHCCCGEAAQPLFCLCFGPPPFQLDPAQYRENRIKVIQAKKAKGGNPYPHKFQVGAKCPSCFNGVFWTQQSSFTALSAFDHHKGLNTISICDIQISCHMAAHASAGATGTCSLCNLNPKMAKIQWNGGKAAALKGLGVLVRR